MKAKWGPNPKCFGPTTTVDHSCTSTATGSSIRASTMRSILCRVMMNNLKEELWNASTEEVNLCLDAIVAVSGGNCNSVNDFRGVRRK